VLFQRPLLDGLATGTITLTFRRWRRPAARPGSRHRSPIGVIAIEAVDLVTTAEITEDDARRAGFGSRAELLADLEKFGDAPIHRIALHLDGPDPRIALREQVVITADERAELARRLARYDAASRHGPWTAATLQLIADHPTERAEDLAARVGREKLPFKVDVRKLKELGLTESLETGYRLSPRGESFLRDA
jgi:hypothetical protein